MSKEYIITCIQCNDKHNSNNIRWINKKPICDECYAEKIFNGIKNKKDNDNA